MATKVNIKEWFRTGRFPTQSQFWQFIDSCYVKDNGDKLEIGDINGLTEALNSKAASGAGTQKMKLPIELTGGDDPVSVNCATEPYGINILSNENPEALGMNTNNVIWRLIEKEDNTWDIILFAEDDFNGILKYML